MQARQALFAALLISIGVLSIELAGGLLYGSVALVADALHVTTDIFAVSLSLVALRLASRPPTGGLTYGYHRIEVVAGLVNGLSLMAITGIIAFQAYQRFVSPVHVVVEGTVALASAALVLNLLSSMIIRRSAAEAAGSEDLNVSSAEKHILGDALASFAVIVGAAAVFVTGQPLFDPLVAAFIGALVLNSAFRISQRSLAIILDRSPIRDMEGLGSRLAQTEGVANVHDFHVWRICSHITVASLHACLDEGGRLRRESVTGELEEKLNEVGVQHTTIQLEDVTCTPSHVHPQTGSV